MKKTALVVLAIATVAALAPAGRRPPAAASSSRPVAPRRPSRAAAPAEARGGAGRGRVRRIKAMSAEEIEKSGLLAEVYFDFDRADIREADRAVLAKNADALKRFDFLRVTVEGHCDERGTVEYTSPSASGARGPPTTTSCPSAFPRPPEDRLLRQGVPACTQSTEECWQRNRRGHFTVTGK